MRWTVGGSADVILWTDRIWKSSFRTLTSWRTQFQVLFRPSVGRVHDARAKIYEENVFLKQCKFDGPETNLADVPIQWRDKSHYFAFWFCRRGAAAGGDTLLNWTTRCVARHAICFIWKWPKKKMPSSRFFVVKLPVSWWPTSTSANFRRLVISTVFFGCQSNMQISGSWKEWNTFFFFWPSASFIVIVAGVRSRFPQQEVRSLN